VIHQARRGLRSRSRARCQRPVRPATVHRTEPVRSETNEVAPAGLRTRRPLHGEIGPTAYVITSARHTSPHPQDSHARDLSRVRRGRA
jgi:hypothetical protein